MKIMDIRSFLVKQRFLVGSILVTLCGAVFMWIFFHKDHIGLGMIALSITVVGYSCIGAYFMPEEIKAWEEYHEFQSWRKKKEKEKNKL
jgi:hypothetical protein